MFLKFHSAPEAVRDKIPEERQYAIAGIDYPYVTFFVDTLNDIARYGFGLHEHRIFERATKQGCVYETGADIGEADIQSVLVGLLLQCL